jgi:hypothetical protein
MNPTCPEKVSFVTAILDTAATHSLVTIKAARAAGGKVINDTQQTFSGVGGKSVTMKVGTCKMRIASVLNDCNIDVVVRCVDAICRPLRAVELFSCDLPLQEGQRLTEGYPRPASEVELLIGADLIPEVLSGSIQRGGKGGKIMIWNTVFGPAVGGVIPKANQSNQPVIPVETEINLPELSRALQNFWNWETIGIAEETVTLHSPDEIYAIEHFYRHEGRGMSSL